MDYSRIVQLPGSPLSSGAPTVPNSTISHDSTRGNAAEEQRILSELRERTGRTGKLTLSSNSESGDPRIRLMPRDTSLPRIIRRSSEPSSEDESMSDGEDLEMPKPPTEWKPKWRTALENPPGTSTETIPQAATNGIEHSNAVDDLETEFPKMKGAMAIVQDDLAASDKKGLVINREGTFAGGASTSDHLNSTYALAKNVQSRLADDLLQESENAAVFGYLLDHIEKLRWINDTLHDRLLKGAEHVTPKTVEPPVLVPKTSKARIQTLYEISCGNFLHHHNETLSLDLPMMLEQNPKNSSRPYLQLVGRKSVPSIEVYLEEHPEISFVVLKPVTCVQESGRDYWESNEDSIFCSCRRCVQMDIQRGRMSTSPSQERIRIVAPELKRALRKLGNCRPDGRVVGPDNDLVMEAPYLFLYHHRSELAKAIQENDAPEQEHLELLKTYLDEHYDDEYSEADELFSRGMVSRKHLSKLFKPNQVVISKEEKPVAQTINWWPYAKHESLHIHSWVWEFDGFALQRRAKQLTLKCEADKIIPIVELEYFPMDLAKPDLVDTITERGKKYWSMRNRYFAGYAGWDALNEYFYRDNRFMIDVRTHARMHDSNKNKEIQARNSRHTLSDIVEYDRWPLTVPIAGAMTDQIAMMLSKTIEAFEVETKKWVTLNVEQIEPVIWNKKAFDRLVLDSQSKELIKALVSVHLSSKKTGDIITGKGNGLIILLHGSPGVGKTLTAESVAELAEKPLYRVTCGDIGTKPEDVEKYLRTVLYLGKIWDCVLLMDEADVFLEERTMADLQRNSLVSVFLRILESYDGILMLTSNRVGTFDEAFKSRIQVALHYKPLNRPSRKQIWRNFFDMMEERNEELEIENFEKRLDELAAQEMNGRQIRNCLQTARQLSEFKDEPLNWNSLSMALKTAADFQRYLSNIHGHSDETWAREERIR